MKENLIKLLIEEFGHLPECTDMDRLSWNGYDYIEIRLNNGEEREYRVILEDMIERVFEESATEMIDDYIIPDLPGNLKHYFDYDKMINDMESDGYGHHFNGYDGGEILGHGIYLFRNN